MGTCLSSCVNYRSTTLFIESALKQLKFNPNFYSSDIYEPINDIFRNAKKFTENSKILFTRTASHTNAIYLFQNNGVLLIQENENEQEYSIGNLVNKVVAYVDLGGLPILNNGYSITLDNTLLGVEETMRFTHSAVAFFMVYGFLYNSSKNYPSAVEVPGSFHLATLYYQTSSNFNERQGAGKRANSLLCDLNKIKYTAASTIDNCDLLFSLRDFFLFQGVLVSIIDENMFCWGKRPRFRRVCPSYNRCDRVCPGIYRVSSKSCSPVFGASNNMNGAAIAAIVNEPECIEE